MAKTANNCFQDVDYLTAIRRRSLLNSRILLVIVFVGYLACLGARGNESALAEVPFCDDGTSVRIPVTLFGEKVYFTIDTGSDLTYLDSPYLPRLGTPVASGTLSSTASQPVEAVAYRAPEIVFGSARIDPGLVGCLDIAMLRMIAGERFEGILGMNAMRRYVVSFNSDKDLLSIRGDVPPDIREHALAVPLTKAGAQERFGLQARLNGVGPINLQIDSGDNRFLSLNEKDWQMVFKGVKEKSHESLFVGADGKTAKAQMARIAEVIIGTNKYTNIIARLLPNPDTSSTIGFGFIQRHLTTFDFPNQVMYLIPGKQFGTVEEVDMSGLRLIKVNSKVVVHSVNEESPAFVAGIRGGDEILSINGKTSASLSLKSIRETLRKKNGETITIEANQRGELNKLKFQLKKFI